METCWIKTPIHGAFKEFYTVLQLQIPKHNFNVVRTLIWSLPIILIENEIMMQHSRHSVCSLAIFKERLFSACYEKNPVTYTSSKFFLESSILTEWSRNPSSNWDADWKGRNKMGRGVRFSFSLSSAFALQNCRSLKKWKEYEPDHYNSTITGQDFMQGSIPNFILSEGFCRWLEKHEHLANPWILSFFHFQLTLLSTSIDLLSFFLRYPVIFLINFN